MLISVVNQFYGKMYSTMDKMFSDWLVEQMSSRNMSQADLARASGLTRGGVSNLVNQVRNPDPETCNLLAKAFGIPPEFVYQAAGLLPEKKSEDHFAKEAEYLVQQLPTVQKAIAVNYLRFLVAEAEKEKSK